MTTEEAEDSTAGMLAATRSESWQRIGEISDRLREAHLEVERLTKERNEALLEAIDLYHFSYRQAARAAGISTSRIHGILANQ